MKICDMRLVIVLLFINPTCSEAADSWHYPLEIQAGLSSNFGEFRGNRVHTGVDLRTNGQVGYKVFAIDDGTIARLAVNKFGFGNALYIQHPNGLMSVYGHLQRFENRTLGLQKLVKQHQKQRNTKYPGNIFLKKAVKRGDVIAYSGESGYGLPHLHFEVRHGGDAPIDPFEHGFSYRDNEAPVIEGLLIEPLGSQSFVEGEHFARFYEVKEKQGEYRFEHLPRVFGKIRFTLATYDRIGAKNRCGVDELRLFIDGGKFFTNVFDRVTYNSNHRGGLVYDFIRTRLSNPSRYYYRLYTLSPSLYPYRQVFAKNKGRWDTAVLTPGAHQITLEALDAMGNSSRAEMTVLVEPSQPALLNAASASADWRVELREFAGFLEIVCRTALPLQDVPTLQLSGSVSAPTTQKMSAQGAQLYAATYDLRPEDKGMLRIRVSALTQNGQPLETVRRFPVQPIFAKRGGTARYGEEAAMSFPAGALYEDIFANIFPTTAYRLTDGLPVAGGVYDFRPAGAPLEKKGRIRIQYPAHVKDVQKLGIFWWDAVKERWYFMDDERDAERRTLSARIIYPSIYGILKDTVPPVISDMQPEAGKTFSASELRRLSALIKDVGKGVDESSIVMRLDDKTLAGEYDPDRRKFSYFLTKSLSVGKHTLSVQARDKAGNPAHAETSTFIVE